MRRAIHRQRRMAPRAVSLLLAAGLLFSNNAPSIACAPEFPLAVMVNGIHPDFPLKRFASGQLGIIQPGWAQSYLLVSYRYLSGLPLDQEEQFSIFALWSKRFAYADFYTDDVVYNPAVEYFTMRAKVLGLKVLPGAKSSDFQYSPLVMDDAFRNALTNLKTLIKNYGVTSPRVKEWLAAQDAVFGVNEKREQSKPQPLPANADPAMRMYRDYQIAAALYYQNEYAEAQKSFEKIAASDCPWKDLAHYMAARSLAMSVFSTDAVVTSEKAQSYVRALIDRSTNSKYKGDLIDLYELLENQMSGPETSMERLAPAVLKAHSQRFGNDIGDFTAMMAQCVPTSAYKDGNSDDKPDLQKAQALRDKYDVIDWLACVQQREDYWTDQAEDQKQARAKQKQDNAAHAVERWRKTKSLPWLVAAIGRNDLADKNNSDLFAAASKVSPQSPAYLTAQFYIVQAMLKTNRKAEAGRLLSSILTRQDLPPSARNLFLLQRLNADSTLAQYMQDIFQPALQEISAVNTAQLPAHWHIVETRPTYYTCAPTVANDKLAEDLNRHLPQSYWEKLARNSKLHPALRARVVRVAWLRSKLLERDAGLDDLMVQTHPWLKKPMGEYRSAASPEAKRFALAVIVLNNFGMSPYLGAGVERHGEKLNQFDYYHTNFWQPYPASDKKAPPDPYAYDGQFPGLGEDLGINFLGSDDMRAAMFGLSTPKIKSLLSAAERKQAEQEQTILAKNPPSKFFGDAVFQWVKSHPADSRNPHLLYSILKMPRWSGLAEVEDPTAKHLRLESQYSRTAFNTLHKQYPGNSWTKSATTWY